MIDDKPFLWVAVTPSGKILEAKVCETRPLMLPPCTNRDLPSWVRFEEVAPLVEENAFLEKERLKLIEAHKLAREEADRCRRDARLSGEKLRLQNAALALNHVSIGAANEKIASLQSLNATYREALKITLTYGLPPHDCSGKEQWQKAVETLAKGEEMK